MAIIKVDYGTLSGVDGVFIQRGKPSSATITCGFQASKIYLSDPNYNTSHLLIRVWDYAIEPDTYVQRYDTGTAIIPNSSAPFITQVTTTGFTLGDLYSLLSNKVVIMACR